MHELPMHINTSITQYTKGIKSYCSSVVFKEAKPSKKDYRHFHIKTVEGPDDFASMIKLLPVDTRVL